MMAYSIWCPHSHTLSEKNRLSNERTRLLPCLSCGAPTISERGCREVCERCGWRDEPVREDAPASDSAGVGASPGRDRGAAKQQLPPYLSFPLLAAIFYGDYLFNKWSKSWLWFIPLDWVLVGIGIAGTLFWWLVAPVYCLLTGRLYPRDGYRIFDFLSKDEGKRVVSTGPRIRRDLWGNVIEGRERKGSNEAPEHQGKAR